MRIPALLAVAVIPLAAMTACSKTTTTGSIELASSDSACTLATTTFPAGKVSFNVKNTGSKATEVYVYGGGDKIVAEVENIGPGTGRTLSADLSAGTYEVACKPGQVGSGIRTTITVTGTAVGASSTGTAAFDKELEVIVTASGVSGVAGFTAVVGKTIEFSLNNKTDNLRELKVVGPDGKAVGEVDAEAGEETHFTATVTATGIYKVIVEKGPKALEATFVVVAL